MSSTVGSHETTRVSRSCGRSVRKSDAPPTAKLVGVLALLGGDDVADDESSAGESFSICGSSFGDCGTDGAKNSAVLDTLN